MLNEKILDYIVLERGPETELDEGLPEDDGEEALDDYVADDLEGGLDGEVDFEGLNSSAAEYFSFIEEDNTLMEICLEIGSETEDYESYDAGIEYESEQQEGLYIALEEVPNLYSGLDPDERAFIFWQAFIAKLPSDMWYMSNRA